jgi:hypothetical protein
MRAAVVLLAVAMLGCRTGQAARPSPAELGLVYMYPAMHAGCYTLTISAAAADRPPPAYPSVVGLDTAYLVVGVPEPVAFRMVTMVPAWRARLPGRHYWRGQDSSVVIEYRGFSTVGCAGRAAIVPRPWAAVSAGYTCHLIKGCC